MASTEHESIWGVWGSSSMGVQGKKPLIRARVRVKPLEVDDI